MDDYLNGTHDPPSHVQYNMQLTNTAACHVTCGKVK